MSFKAEFEKLAESSLQGSDSEERQGDGGGTWEGTWKQRTKKLQKLVKWQLAEAEAQVCEKLTSTHRRTKPKVLYARGVVWPRRCIF